MKKGQQDITAFLKSDSTVNTKKRKRYDSDDEGADTPASDDRDSRQTKYIKSVAEEINTLTKKYESQMIEKNAMAPKIALIGFLEELKHNPVEAFDANAYKDKQIVITKDLFSLLLKEPLYKIFDQQGYSKPVDENSKSLYSSKADEYIEDAQMKANFGQDTYIDKLYAQMWKIGVDCGSIKSMSEYLKNTTRMKKVEVVSYAQIRDYFREPNPFNGTERYCSEYNPITGECTCASFRCGGFVCREWVLPSKRSDPLPEERNMCLFCIREVVTEIFVKLRMFKIPCLFVLHDHMVEEDSNGEYCAEGNLKQGDGFYGIVGPFPSHSGERYQAVKFVRIEGHDDFVPLAGDESELSHYVQVLHGWQETAPFFYRLPPTYLPP
jgi:hypothetical protein